MSLPSPTRTAAPALTTEAVTAILEEALAQHDRAVMPVSEYLAYYLEERGYELRPKQAPVALATCMDCQIGWHGKCAGKPCACTIVRCGLNS